VTRGLTYTTGGHRVTPAISRSRSKYNKGTSTDRWIYGLTLTSDVRPIHTLECNLLCRRGGRGEGGVGLRRLDTAGGGCDRLWARIEDGWALGCSALSAITYTAGGHRVKTEGEDAMLTPPPPPPPQDTDQGTTPHQP